MLIPMNCYLESLLMTKKVLRDLECHKLFLTFDPIISRVHIQRPMSTREMSFVLLFDADDSG